ncbi:hypothetical protein MVES1_001785 [Malassezia vespertilionis]|uniref:Ferrochelatase, mitochondrial n=1 Tax=Malassezia vespertilionis TaxID=2020962 RepID=A0A2N1JDJ3_9BASI|nr:uncharacterized protein MVES1_001785 [Malassezia vespertilionis]PKI84604.1 Hem15p [Malassezia vespertilionis]WFD06440.1 hypothetical protein MVES1_001785 [Malassezia vespertilionis]
MSAIPKAGVRTFSTSIRHSKPPTAVVMMNMGGPADLDEVNPFLTRLFLDRDLMRLPFQSRLAPMIATRRTSKVRDQYDQIGGGSPILRWTRTQGDAMAKMLDELNPASAPHKAYVAFRYASPLTEECMNEMEADGVQRAVGFSQYPQYSCSTTGSSLNQLYREIKQREEAGTPGGDIQWSIIDRWPTHAGLIQAFCNRVKEGLAKFPAAVREQVPIMFSAHSLPMQVVSGRGDPYPAEVAATVAAVMQKLGWKNPYRLTWQSQVGPSAWLGPQTSDTLKGWAKQGHKNALVVPVAFTSDHIETLFELDIELQEDAHKFGIHLERAPSLNDEPVFLRALADIVSEHLYSCEYTKDGGNAHAGVPWAQGSSSYQMALRCPGCVNADCAHQKQFFLA